MDDNKADTETTTCRITPDVSEPEPPPDESSPPIDYCPRTDKSISVVFRQHGKQSTFQFLVTTLGYSIGFSNVIRFPYIVYRSGGLVFLIPYVVLMFIFGLPAIFTEISLGQFTGRASCGCWEFAPVIEGIGLASMVVAFLSCNYVSYILSWIVTYLVASFTTTSLPWDTAPMCGETLEDPQGCHFEEFHNCTMCGLVYNSYEDDGTCRNATTNAIGGIFDIWKANVAFGKKLMPSVKYIKDVVLGNDCYLKARHPCPTYLPNCVDEEDPCGSTIPWHLVGNIAAIWLIVFVVEYINANKSKYVTYVSALLPYTMMVALYVQETVRFFTNGAEVDYTTGPLKDYLTVSMDRLLDTQLWITASVQVMLTLGPSSGVLISLASYNPFDKDVLRHSLFIVVGNTLSSLLCLYIVFLIIAHRVIMCEDTDGHLIVEHLVSFDYYSSLQLYSFALTFLPVSPLFAVLLFVTFLNLGMNALYIYAHTIFEFVQNTWPRTRSRQSLTKCVLCLSLFVTSLPYLHHRGYSLFWSVSTIVDYFLSTFVALVLSLALGWVYGAERFFDDVTRMLGGKVYLGIPWEKLKWFWVVQWRFFMPAYLSFIIIYSLATSTIFFDTAHAPPLYVLPYWATIANVVAFASGPTLIFGFAFWKFFPSRVRTKIAHILRVHVCRKEPDSCPIDYCPRRKRSLKLGDVFKDIKDDIFKPTEDWDPMTRPNIIEMRGEDMFYTEFSDRTRSNGDTASDVTEESKMESKMMIADATTTSPNSSQTRLDPAASHQTPNDNTSHTMGSSRTSKRWSDETTHTYAPDHEIRVRSSKILKENDDDADSFSSCVE